MKILIHGDGTVVYGAERQAALIAAGLVARGNDVVFSCPPDTPFQELLEKHAIPTVHVRPRGNLDLFSALRFAGWIRAERPDAFLATSWKRAHSVGWAARRAGVRRSVLRIGQTKPVGTRSGEWRVRHAVRHFADALVGPSVALAAFLHERFPFFPAEEIHVVWNAVEPLDTSGSMLRRELQIGDAPLVLAVGGLSRRKGHHLLLEAFSRLDMPDAHLAVAGSGSQEEELKRQTAELGLEARVHWLGHRADVPRLLGAADVFTLTSRHEAMPNALLEAMAAGLPVISTPVAGSEIMITEANGRGPAGWLVPFDDAHALAQTLSQVLDGKRRGVPEVTERTAEARWRTQHWFGVERMVAGYEAVLRGGARYDDADNFTRVHARAAR